MSCARTCSAGGASAAPSQDGFVTVLRAERHETVHAEPFDDIAVSVSALFGDDPSDSP